MPARFKNEWPAATLNDDGCEIDVEYRSEGELLADFGDNVKQEEPSGNVQLRWGQPSSASTRAKAAGVLRGWKVLGRVRHEERNGERHAELETITFSKRWRGIKAWKTMVQDLKSDHVVFVRFQGPGTTRWFDGETWRNSSPRQGHRTAPDPGDLEHWQVLEDAGELDPWPGDGSWFSLMLRSCSLQPEERRCIEKGKLLGKHFLWLADGPSYESKLHRSPAWRVRAPGCVQKFPGGKETVQFGFELEPHSPIATLRRCIELFEQAEHDTMAAIPTPAASAPTVCMAEGQPTAAALARKVIDVASGDDGQWQEGGTRSPVPATRSAHTLGGVDEVQAKRRRSSGGEFALDQELVRSADPFRELALRIGGTEIRQSAGPRTSGQSASSRSGVARKTASPGSNDANQRSCQEVALLMAQVRAGSASEVAAQLKAKSWFALFEDVGDVRKEDEDLAWCYVCADPNGAPKQLVCQLSEAALRRGDEVVRVHDRLLAYATQPGAVISCMQSVVCILQSQAWKVQPQIVDKKITNLADKGFSYQDAKRMRSRQDATVLAHWIAFGVLVGKLVRDMGLEQEEMLCETKALLSWLTCTLDFMRWQLGYGWVTGLFWNADPEVAAEKLQECLPRNEVRRRFRPELKRWMDLQENAWKALDEPLGVTEPAPKRRNTELASTNEAAHAERASVRAEPMTAVPAPAQQQWRCPVEPPQAVTTAHLPAPSDGAGASELVASSPEPTEQGPEECTAAAAAAEGGSGSTSVATARGADEVAAAFHGHAPAAQILACLGAESGGCGRSIEQIRACTGLPAEAIRRELAHLLADGEAFESILGHYLVTEPPSLDSRPAVSSDVAVSTQAVAAPAASIASNRALGHAVPEPRPAALASVARTMPLRALGAASPPAAWRVEAYVRARRPMNNGVGYILELDQDGFLMRAFVLGSMAQAAFGVAATLPIGSRCAFSGGVSQVRKVEAMYRSRPDEWYKIMYDDRAASTSLLAGISVLDERPDFSAELARSTPIAQVSCLQEGCKISVAAVVHHAGDLIVTAATQLRALTLFAGEKEAFVRLTIFGQAAEKVPTNCVGQVVLAKQATVKVWNSAKQLNTNVEPIWIGQASTPQVGSLHHDYLAWRRKSAPT